MTGDSNGLVVDNLKYELVSGKKAVDAGKRASPKLDLSKLPKFAQEKLLKANITLGDLPAN